MRILIAFILFSNDAILQCAYSVLLANLQINTLCLDILLSFSFLMMLWSKNLSYEVFLVLTGTQWGTVSSCGRRLPYKEPPIWSLLLTLTSCHHPSESTTYLRYSTVRIILSSYQRGWHNYLDKNVGIAGTLFIV